MTLAPSRANALAMPRPMPLVDPVTSAVLPCNMIVPLLWSVGPGHTADATDPSRLGRALEPDVLPRPPCIPVADLVIPRRRNLQPSNLPVHVSIRSWLRPTNMRRRARQRRTTFLPGQNP